MLRQEQEKMKENKVWTHCTRYCTIFLFFSLLLALPPSLSLLSLFLSLSPSLPPFLCPIRICLVSGKSAPLFSCYHYFPSSLLSLQVLLALQDMWYQVSQLHYSAATITFPLSLSDEPVPPAGQLPLAISCCPLAAAHSVQILS